MPIFQRALIGFEHGMKVELVDKRNPILIRVATIVDVQGFRLLIHFDGWDSIYDYWIDEDCPDLHPPHWCEKVGHPLQPPIGKLLIYALIYEKQNARICETVPLLFFQLSGEEGEKTKKKLKYV